jgi:hypothetical protein
MQRKLLICTALALLLTLAAPALAQTGAQFCVRAYEDRNGNQLLDPGEPFLTRDVAAALVDAGGVVIASALMDDSPTAAQGVICFQFLPPGQYSMQITSAVYTPTTPDTVTASIGTGTLPTVVEYGARRADELTAAPAPTATGGFALPDSGVVRAGLSLLGALGVMVLMGIVGLFIYLVMGRTRPAPQPQAAAPARRPPTTGSGSLPPVNAVSDDYLADALGIEDEDQSRPS